MKKNKLANTNFTRLCELLKIIQTRFRQLYVVSSQVLYCYILYNYF